MNNTKTSTRNLVLCALLAAIIIVLQLLGSFIKFGPFSVSLVLIPIVVGAAVCGTAYGGILGAVFGFIVIITDSAAFFAINPLATIALCLIKGIFAGLASGAVFNLIKRHNDVLAAISASIVCPIVNTGIFLIFCKLFFMGLISQRTRELSFETVGNFIIYSLVGGNFIFELLINVVLSPIIVKLIRYNK